MRARMNVFETHSEIVGDYKSYIESFIDISDPMIAGVVARELEGGKLWPAPLLQFNPAYERKGSVQELVNGGDLHAWWCPRNCVNAFGANLLLVVRSETNTAAAHPAGAARHEYHPARTARSAQGRAIGPAERPLRASTVLVPQCHPDGQVRRVGRPILLVGSELFPCLRR